MRYIINDNEGGSFGSWSHDRPATRKEIIEYFKMLSDDEGLEEDELVPIEHFNLRMIQDIWNVEILPIKLGNRG
jgi:hypothetical protein